MEFDDNGDAVTAIVDCWLIRRELFDTTVVGGDEEDNLQLFTIDVAIVRSNGLCT